MAAYTHDIEFEQESAFDLSIKLVDCDTCVPIPITGYGALFQVRATRDSASPVIYEASTADGRVTVEPDGDVGVFHIHLTRVQVNAAAVWSKGYWDFLIWPPEGTSTDDAKRIVEGEAIWDEAAAYISA